MHILKSFISLFFLISLSFATFTGCSDSTTGRELGDNSTNNNGSGGGNQFTDIDFPANPLSLIAAYSVDTYSIGGESAEVLNAAPGSELRVNFNISNFKIQLGFIIKPDVASAYLTRNVTMESVDLDQIAKIFTDLGAKVIDTKHLQFVMTSENYPELVRKGIIQNGETLTINLTKTRDLTVGAGLGADFEVQPDPGIGVESVSITYNGQNYATIEKNSSITLDSIVLPVNATDNQLEYSSSDSGVAIVSYDGVISALGTGTATITATSSNGKTASFIVTVETSTTSIYFVYDEKGIPLNGKEIYAATVDGDAEVVNKVVKYSISDLDKAFVSINEDTGEVTGKALTGNSPVTVTATYIKIDGSKMDDSYKLNVFTPMDFSNPKSLEGTYEIADFVQTNNVNQNIGTTQDYKGTVQRMFGELTITVNGNTLTVISKVQMDSSKMQDLGNFGDANKGQFSNTNFKPMTFNSISQSFQSANYGDLGNIIKPGKVTIEDGKGLNDSGRLNINQEFKQMSIATVTVNTYMVKKSDVPVTLNDKIFYWCNNIDGSKANAMDLFTDVSCPVNEPNMILGIISHP